MYEGEQLIRSSLLVDRACCRSARAHSALGPDKAWSLEAHTAGGRVEVYLITIVEDRHLMSSRQQLPCEVEAKECMATALRIDDQDRIRARTMPCALPRLCSVQASVGPAAFFPKKPDVCRACWVI